MFTPRPRESEGASSPSGRDVEYEKLPPSAIPARLDSTKKMELEAERVGHYRFVAKSINCSLNSLARFEFNS